MAGKRKLIRAGAASILALAVAMLLIAQGAIAHFAAAHLPAGCHDIAASNALPDDAVSDAHAHDDAHGHGDAGDHHPAPAPAQDGMYAKLFDCCGWMCTAAICAPALASLSNVLKDPHGRRSSGVLPSDWLAFGLDRPPRPIIA